MVNSMAEFELFVKGQKVKTNAFVAGVFHDVILALLNNLHDMDIEDITRVRIE